MAKSPVSLAMALSSRKRPPTRPPACTTGPPQPALRAAASPVELQPVERIGEWILTEARVGSMAAGLAKVSGGAAASSHAPAPEWVIYKMTLHDPSTARARYHSVSAGTMHDPDSAWATGLAHGTSTGTTRLMGRHDDGTIISPHGAMERRQARPRQRPAGMTRRMTQRSQIQILTPRPPAAGPRAAAAARAMSPSSHKIRPCSTRSLHTGAGDRSGVVSFRNTAAYATIVSIHWTHRSPVRLRASRSSCSSLPLPDFSTLEEEEDAPLFILEAGIARRASRGTDELRSSCCRTRLSWLKLTSRTTMMLEANSSDGRPPEKELYERLRCSKLVRSARDGEMLPSRPLDAKETWTTIPSALQVMPSHLQQSVWFRHAVARPLSSDSPVRNRRREPISCSLHEVAGEANESSSSSRGAMLKESTAIMVLLPLLELG
ncbi:hypothetical protein HU200_043995 [Digitaria exilis]|uniref:Uncharacterized protein n=1 Tax=Digitaria exilis TaxID=1010633 RepID=A0A835B3J2_9POAL|nr:hypothetical protein HU200_043995 [Digitaria exilis]